MSRVARVDLPSFGAPDALPPISVAEYQARLDGAVEAMARQRFDFLFVYADREHCANMAYLLGFDPRFEEAVLLLDRRGRRRLIVGNECMGYLPDPEIGYEAVLFQEFSLLGQPRQSSRPLRQILADFGIGRGLCVGCVGWKYFGDGLVEGGELALEIPAYMVDLLRDLTGERRLVRNATALFMNPVDGLRITNSADQIAQFEFAAVRTSESVLAALQHTRVGVAENDLERYLECAGLPLSCHRNVGFGDKARRGLASPSANQARLGDALTIGLGVWGSLTSRAGVVASGAQDLPAEVRDFYPRFVENYYDVVVAWYESLHLGVTGGTVYAQVEARRNPALYDFAVNPGHCIHLEEWIHSPFEAGSTAPIRSGFALQMDIIPVSRGPFCYSNCEDTLAIADEDLRAELAARHPGCWQRIEMRRRFMVEALGIRLDECVLPLGNTPAWLPPYALKLDVAMVNR